MLGALFFALLIFYVIVHLQPVSILERSSVERWTQGLDKGTLDLQMCYTGEPLDLNQCKASQTELLEDILYTGWLEKWHNSVEGKQEPTVLHYHLNY